jgi:Reverse transcriptase (RNA-dependent DNA polymerase)
MLDMLHGAKHFTKIDLSDAFYQLRMHEPDIPKTAFRTRYGLFEFKVMPMGLANSPASFQKLANQVFADILDDFMCIYLDDIIIYSKTLEDHRRHVHLFG